MKKRKTAVKRLASPDVVNDVKLVSPATVIGGYCEPHAIKGAEMEVESARDPWNSCSFVFGRIDIMFWPRTLGKFHGLKEIRGYIRDS